MIATKKARALRELLCEERLDGRVVLRPDRFALFKSLTESRDPKTQLKLSDYSIQDLAEVFHPRWRAGGFGAGIALAEGALRESDTPVGTSFFPQIVSQLMFSEIRAQFELEDNVFSQLVPTIMSKIKGTQIVPSVVGIDPDDAEVVLEGARYPAVGFGEEYFTLPASAKRGLRVLLTREAIHFDQTGDVVDQARKVGEALGRARENAVIDVLIGQVNNYSRNGTASNTYLTAGAYVNNQSSNPLNDWRDIQAALDLFTDILDPTTGEPLQHDPQDLIVSPQRVPYALQVLNATEVRNQENASAGTRDVTMLVTNPISGRGFRLHSSNRFYQRILAGPEPTAATAQAGWFLGSIAKAFAWYEVWPLTVVQKGPESQANFDADVEMQFKASYYGVATVREPRYMTRIEDTAW